MVADEPQWLTEHEQAAWLGLATVLIALPRELDARLRRDADLSHFEYIVMAMLSESAGYTRTMTNLAALTGATLSRLSHVVSRLEKRGWIRRAASAQDARSTEATLTEAGYAKVVEVAPTHVSHVRDLVIDALTESQLGQLRRITERINDRLA